MQLNCVQQYLGQILETVEKLLILHIVIFMPGLSKWKLLSNYSATFNLENINLQSNPNVNPKNQVAYKNKIFQYFTPNSIGDLLRRSIRGLQSRNPTPLLQSSEIPNLGLTAQIGNFWLTPWWFCSLEPPWVSVISSIKVTIKSFKIRMNFFYYHYWSFFLPNHFTIITLACIDASTITFELHFQ